MQSTNDSLKKRFLDGLAMGSGFSIALVGAFVIVSVLGFLFEWYAQGKSARTEFHEWSQFVVLNSSHRLISGTEDDDGLYIVGELEFREIPPYEVFWITATLRDETGGFVDSCQSRHYTRRVPVSGVESFRIACRFTTDPNAFSNYAITVEAFDE